MQFSACDEATPSDELNSANPPKKAKMQVSTSNNTPCIRIEQLVKHDVWDIRKKDDGAFVMKKLPENDAGTSSNIRAINLNADTRTNAEKTGARPKVIVEVPKTNGAVTVNTANRLQSVNHVNNDSTVTAKPENAPRMEMIMPKKSVITLMPTNTQKNRVIAINTTPAPPKNVFTVKSAVSKIGSAATAPEVEVITQFPNREVLDITTPPPPRKEVITINTKPLVRPAVFTINTGTKKDEQPLPGQIQGSMNMGKHTGHDTWNLPKENSGPVAGASNIDSGPSVSGEGKSDDVQSSSVPFYSDEVYHQLLQDMFPQVPLSVISENLRVCGSVESAIDSLLAQGVPDSEPSSELPPASPGDDDDVVFIKSVEANKPKTDSISNGKKGGATIKIELLTKNEVWDIKRKDKEGFVLKKNSDDKTEPQYSIPKASSYPEFSAEVKEEEHDPMLDDIFMDDMTHVGNQSNAPVKLMVYSKSSDSMQPASERKNVTPLGEENLDSTMEVDDFDNLSCLQETVSVEAFEFSDDENEDGETVEHFVFKSSLILKKLKYRCETETQTLEDSGLLNITGSTKNEDASRSMETKEDCAGSDEYFTDEYYTDEEEDEEK